MIPPPQYLREMVQTMLRMKHKIREHNCNRKSALAKHCKELPHGQIAESLNEIVLVVASIAVQLPTNTMLLVICMMHE